MYPYSYLIFYSVIHFPLNPVSFFLPLLQVPVLINIRQLDIDISSDISSIYLILFNITVIIP